MSGEAVLTSLHIEGFRTFRKLDVTGLGHVNLLVGRNNTGKTMLLEAVRLLVSGGDPAVILELLVEHDELDRGVGIVGGELASRSRDRLRRRSNQAVLDFRALFHGRPALAKGQPLSCAVVADDAYAKVQLVLDSGSGRDNGARPSAGGGEPDDAGLREGLYITLPGETGVFLPAGVSSDRILRYLSSPGSATPPLVPAGGLLDEDVAQWWDSVALTDAEERVAECLRLAAPVEKIALVENAWTRGRSVLVRMKGEREPVPLRSLGDGIGRMFWIALAMENARETGVLLLDEIENGIHYTVLPDLWRFIFHTARAHGIQVFAASHSWDCIEAFTKVAVSDDSRGVLVQLARRGDDIVPTVASEDELRIATRDGIEVRG